MNEQLLNIKFVQEVEKYPVLYNFNLPEYSRRDVTDKAWAEVGKTVNLSGQQCREKWKNLRCVFVRQFKRNPNTSKGKKTYYLMNYMQFTLPFVKTLRMLPEYGQYHSPDVVMDDEENEEGDPLLSLKAETPYLSPTPYETDTPTVNMQFSPKSQETYPLSPQSNATDESPTKKAKKRKNSDLSKVVVDYYSEKNEKKEEKELADDHRKMFLLSLQPDINIMSDMQMRTFKRRVLAVIEEILQESPSTLSHVQREELPITKEKTLEVTNEKITVQLTTPK